MEITKLPPPPSPTNIPNTPLKSTIQYEWNKKYSLTLNNITVCILNDKMKILLSFLFDVENIHTQNKKGITTLSHVSPATYFVHSHCYAVSSLSSALKNGGKVSRFEAVCQHLTILNETLFTSALKARIVYVQALYYSANTQIHTHQPCSTSRLQAQCVI